MGFTWSQNAPHIQRLFRPWTPDSGYGEKDVAAAESELETHLPFLLRLFYLNWGMRDDLTRTQQHLLPVRELWFRDDALICCVENQAVWHWAIRREHLSDNNPPVYYAYDEPRAAWHISHTHLSHFLDDLTYQHALAGGACHGAFARERMNDEYANALRQHYQRLVLPSYPAGFIPDAGYKTWELFLGENLVIDTTMTLITVAAQREDDVDHVRCLLGVTWEHVW